MTEKQLPPLPRPDELAAVVYKRKWPLDEDSTVYITVAHIELDGRTLPFEVFLNSRNIEHQSWMNTVALMITAIFRRRGDVSFIVDELKRIVDARGGCVIEKRFCPSIQAMIGRTIETHLGKIQYFGPDEPVARRPDGEPSAPAASVPKGGQVETVEVVPDTVPADALLCGGCKYFKQFGSFNCGRCVLALVALGMDPKKWVESR